MSSTFSGISTALSALQSHRKTMDVIGQNIANANTPGYTRQRAELQSVAATGATSLFSSGTRTPGDGVAVTTVSRAYDALMGARVDSRTADNALLSGRADTLSRLEGVTNEPGDTGLSAQLNAMWSAWSTAGDNAGKGQTTDQGADGASRAVVIGRSQTVADSLRTAWTNVQQLWTTTGTQAQADVLEANTAASDIAKLNEAIQKGVVTGGGANELMDQRDQLVTRLAEITGSTSEPGPNGQVNVFIGGTPLVQGNRSQALKLTLDSSATVSTATASSVGLTFADGTKAYPPSGSLAAQVEALTTTLPGAAKVYDQIALSVITKVNAGQAAGVKGDGTTAGPALFAGTSAANITLTSATGADLALAAPGKGVSDGTNAAAIATTGTAAGSPDGAWSSYVAGLGASSASAAQRSTAAQQTLTSAVSDQQGQSGVSLDEETANLISAQRAYQGAAKVLNALDQMMDVLMSIGR